MATNKKFYQLSPVFYKNEKALKLLMEKVESNSFSLIEHKAYLASPNTADLIE
jgi:hypothetical protein